MQQSKMIKFGLGTILIVFLGICTYFLVHPKMIIPVIKGTPELFPNKVERSTSPIFIPKGYKLSQKEIIIVKSLPSTTYIIFEKLEDAPADIKLLNTLKIGYQESDEITLQDQNWNVAALNKFSLCSLPEISNSLRTEYLKLFPDYSIGVSILGTNCSEDGTRVPVVTISSETDSEDDFILSIAQSFFNNSLLEYSSTALMYNYSTTPLSPLIRFPNQLSVQYIESGIPTFRITLSDIRYLDQKSYKYVVTDSAKSTEFFNSGKAYTTMNAVSYFGNKKPTTNDLLADFTITAEHDGVEIAYEYQSSVPFTYKYSDINPKESSYSGLKMMSWIPAWGMESALVSLRKNPKIWYSLSPVWYSANKNGSLTKQPTFNNYELRRICKKNKIKLVPSIGSFDADIFGSILRNESYRKRHIRDIVNEVVKNNFDGIDLDYESTYESDKANLILFVKELATELHKNKKLLSYTVHSKWTDEWVYSWAPQTHQAQDWAELAKYVDEIRVMSYDFTSQGSKTPGPVSPYMLSVGILKYAEGKVPPEKLVLALPFHAFSWKKKSNGKFESPASAYQPQTVQSIKKASKSFKEKKDPWLREMRAEYNYKGANWIIYYPNSSTLRERYELAKRYKIKGIAFWRIGGEVL